MSEKRARRRRDRNAPPSTPLLDKLLTQHRTADVPRCAHLGDHNDRDAYLVLPLRHWRCERCTARAGAGLYGKTPFCDGCDRFMPSETFTPMLARNGRWVVMACLCGRCTEQAKRQGFHQRSQSG